MGQLKPNQVLNKAYRQVAVGTEHFNRFKDALYDRGKKLKRCI